MCHRIRKTKDNCFLKYDSYYIGMKQFRINEEKSWIGESFNWDIEKLGISKVGLNIYPKLTYQDILFDVTLTSTAYAKIITGAHIRSFNINEIYLIHWNDPSFLLRWFNLLVLFKSNNIKFFDGINVSVSCFTIPNIKILKDILKIHKHTNVFKVREKRLEYYEESFQYIKNVLVENYGG